MGHAHVLTDAMYQDGDHLTWRFRFGGTHVGDFLGVPATGKAVVLSACDTARAGVDAAVDRGL